MHGISLPLNNSVRLNLLYVLKLSYVTKRTNCYFRTIELKGKIKKTLTIELYDSGIMRIMAKLCSK